MLAGKALVENFIVHAGAKGVRENEAIALRKLTARAPPCRLDLLYSVRHLYHCHSGGQAIISMTLLLGL
jgi:hypothetical protein